MDQVHTSCGPQVYGPHVDLDHAPSTKIDLSHKIQIEWAKGDRGRGGGRRRGGWRRHGWSFAGDQEKVLRTPILDGKLTKTMLMASRTHLGGRARPRADRDGSTVVESGGERWSSSEAQLRRGKEGEKELRRAQTEPEEAPRGWGVMFRWRTARRPSVFL